MTEWIEEWTPVVRDGHPRVHWENGQGVIHQKMRELPPVQVRRTVPDPMTLDDFREWFFRPEI